MTIFTNLKSEVGRKIQKTDTSYATKIGDFLNRRYEQLWDMFTWTAITVLDEEVTATSGKGYVFLPKYVGQIICLTQRETNTIILPTSPYVFRKQYLDTIADQSDPIAYEYAGENFVIVPSWSSAKVTVVSSSASDTTQKVRIIGKLSGEEQTELLTLTGTTAVTSTNNYTSLTKVSKDGTTAGYITIKIGTTTLCTIEPNEYASQYIRINLHYVPDSNITLYLCYKKRFKRLVNNEDVLDIPAIEPTLIRLSYSDCLREQRQFSKAEVEENKAISDLNTLILGQEIQKDQVIQMLPHVEKLDIDVPL